MPEPLPNENQENEQGNPPMHTPTEVELQRQLDVLRAENEQLKENNSQLFRLAMGSQNDDTRSPLQKKMQRFFDSHFNLSELSKEVK